MTGYAWRRPAVGCAGCLLLPLAARTHPYTRYKEEPCTSAT
ncbi:hypothetical protein [Streptomyces sp. DSM 40907]|nr:hypothetical protein [Streptomyces sp. DSM 40907]